LQDGLIAVGKDRLVWVDDRRGVAFWRREGGSAETHPAGRGVFGTSCYLDWTNAVNGHYAGIRAELERSGTPIENMDLFFASRAVSQRMILVTNDLRLEGARSQGGSVGLIY
jgi:hypothetical protein